MFIKNLKKIQPLVVLFVFLISCGTTKDEIDPKTGERKIYENNPQKKAEAYRDKGGGIFNTSRKSSNNNFEFNTSNVLWRASLSSLGLIPLQNVDYSGGVILTDWYSPSDSFSKESIKIKIRFLSNELAVSSIEVVSHKKICDNDNACKIVQMPETFSNKIKDKIILQAKNIKIEEEKNKK